MQTPINPEAAHEPVPSAAVVQAMQRPDLAKRMADQGGLPAPMSPAQFRDFIKTESAQYARIVEFAKIVAE